jgi:hypothetical protein
MKQRLVLLFFWFVILLTNIVIQVWMLASIITGSNRAMEIALAYDRLGNAAMGRGNETISSWCGKRNGWQERFINKLFEWMGAGTNHCDNSREVQ